MRTVAALDCIEELTHGAVTASSPVHIESIPTVCSVLPRHPSLLSSHTLLFFVFTYSRFVHLSTAVIRYDPSGSMYHYGIGVRTK